MINRLAAEAIGTFWLVFAGCGSALLSAGIPQLGIGVFGITLEGAAHHGHVGMGGEAGRTHSDSQV